MLERKTESESNEALSLQASMAQGHSFFCRRIAIPGDIDESELESFLQLQVESLSPFPLEHLQYGFVVDSNRQFAFLYAAYRRSFETSTVGDWENRDAVIPEFSIGVLAGKSEDETPLLIIAESSYTYFEFDAESELPSYFASYAKEEDDVSEDESVKSILSELAKSRSTASARIWSADSVIAINQNTLSLRARDPDGAISAEVDRDALWQMDLRDPEVLERVKIQERRNHLIWRIAIGMAAVFGFLFIGEFIWLAERGYLKLRNGWNEEQAPFVEEIIARKTTINELLSFRESDLIPFDMLVAINPFMTDAVWFTKVETNGANSLKIFASASNNGHANQFKARLERFAKIDTVELRDIQSRPDGTTFTVFLNFKQGAFPGRNAGEEVASSG